MRWGLMAMALLAAPVEAKPADWIAANRAQILAAYVELLAIPNVASDTPTSAATPIASSR